MSWVSAGIAAVGVGSSILGGKKAEAAAKNAAKAQIKALTSQRAAERRQLKRANEVTLGTAKAGVGASNIQFGGSAKRYLGALKMENTREEVLHQQAQRREAEAVREGASGVGAPFYAAAAGDVLGYAARTYAASRIPSTPESNWGNTPGTVTDPFLNAGEASGSFDESF